MPKKQHNLCPVIGANNELDYSKVDNQEFNYVMQPWIRKIFPKRAKVAGNRQQPIEAVNALVYLWIAYNAWLAQVVVDDTKSEKDWYLISAAGRDTQLSGRFNDLLENDASFRETAQKFQTFWPIFKVRWLIDNEIMPWGIQRDNKKQRLSRADYRDLCFSKNPQPVNYAPQCYKQHQDPNLSAYSGGDPTRVPLNWPHTLSAIYQVRCSLFHGGKTFANNRDVELLDCAFQILWSIWGETQLK